MNAVTQCTVQETVAVAPFHTDAFPSCIILATANSLFIGRVQDFNKTHIRSVTISLITQFTYSSRI